MAEAEFWPTELTQQETIGKCHFDVSSDLISKIKNPEWAFIILNLEFEVIRTYSFKMRTITKRSSESRDFCSEGGLVDQGVVGVHNEGFEVVQHINV